jgi:hypothetical protein
MGAQIPDLQFTSLDVIPELISAIRKSTRPAVSSSVSSNSGSYTERE